MNNYVDKSRGRMIIVLGVLLATLWLVIAHAALEDARQEKYDGRVRPGVVESGTRTAAPAPVYVAPRPRTGVPMVSGNAVRSYAHSGHATMPSAAYSSGSGYTMHTTSSAIVHTIGSGGGGSNNQSPITNHQSASSSSRGIQMSGVSVSMPSLALATPTYVAQSEATLAAAPGRNGHVRKAHQDEWGDWYGDYNGEYHEGDGWWNASTEEWSATPFDGAVKIEGGMTYKYDSSLLPGDPWVLVPDQGDPGVPVGATPWLMMLMLAAGYCIAKTIRKKQNAI